MKKYLGVKLIEAEPMTLGDYNTFKGWTIPENECPLKEGYKVKYPDGYISWSPKDIFEKAYMPLASEENKITQEDVDNFIEKLIPQGFGDKTTVVVAVLKNGFEIVESSSCVDPAYFDIQIGTDICLKRIKDKVWELLGFLLQSGVKTL